jgi:hypothetical protein
MGYVLPRRAVDEEELHQVQTKLLAAVLQKFGMSSKTPAPIRHGPKDMGGLALYDIRTEMGIAQLKIIRNAVYNNTEVGKMILISLKYSQIEAGIQEPILAHPSIHIPYLTPTWLMSVRQFLYQHNLTLRFTKELKIRFQGKHDQCIMQMDRLQHYSNQTQRDIKFVRLHLQSITLSDISTPDGTATTREAWNGVRHYKGTERKNWPRQPRPTIYQLKIWRRRPLGPFYSIQNDTEDTARTRGDQHP